MEACARAVWHLSFQLSTQCTLSGSSPACFGRTCWIFLPSLFPCNFYLLCEGQGRRAAPSSSLWTCPLLGLWGPPGLLCVWRQLGCGSCFLRKAVLSLVRAWTWDILPCVVFSFKTHLNNWAGMCFPLSLINKQLFLHWKTISVVMKSALGREIVADYCLGDHAIAYHVYMFSCSPLWLHTECFLWDSYVSSTQEWLFTWWSSLVCFCHCRVYTPGCISCVLLEWCFQDRIIN